MESKLRLCPSREAVIRTLTPGTAQIARPGGGVSSGVGCEVLPLEGIGAKHGVEGMSIVRVCRMCLRFVECVLCECKKLWIN